MKKNLILGVLLLAATGLSAQMYVGLGVGYHMAAQKVVLGTSYNSAGDATNIYGSQGKGIIPALKFGYMIDDNWGLEFGLSYLMGPDQVMEEDFEAPAAGITNYSDVTKSKSSMIRLTPQLVFNSELGIYSRFGLIMPLGGKTTGTRDVSYTAGPSSSKTNIGATYKGSFGTGIAGAIGYKHEINDDMDFFAELEFIGLTLYGKSSTVTKYNVNDADKLADLKTIEKETTYVDVVLATDNTDVNVAQKALKTSSNYSSFGINVGVTYKLK